MSARPRIVLVSRELHPFGGGGIAPVVAALATQLAALADVTLVTTDAHRDALAAAGGATALYGPAVEVLLVRDGAPGRPRPRAGRRSPTRGAGASSPAWPSASPAAAPT